MSFHEARRVFDEALRLLQGDPDVRESTYGQALMQVACAMIELSNATEAGFAEARENLSTVEANLKEHVSREC